MNNFFHSIKKDFDTKTLLTCINFEEVDLIHFLEKALSKPIITLFEQEKRCNVDYFINFFDLRFNKNENKNQTQFYKDLHSTIKQKISKDEDRKIERSYNFFKFDAKPENEHLLCFRVIFISKNKSLSAKDLSYLSNFESQKMSKSVIDILLKTQIISELNNDHYITADIFEDQLFLNAITHSNKNGQRNYSVFKYESFMNNYLYKFTVKLQSFKEKNQLNIKNYSDCVTTGKIDYESKNDARDAKYRRKFIEIDYKKFISCKNGTLLYIYEKLKNITNEFKISHSFENFKPSHIFFELMSDQFSTPLKQIQITTTKEDLKYLKSLYQSANDHISEPPLSFDDYILKLFSYYAPNTQFSFSVISLPDEIKPEIPLIFLMYRKTDPYENDTTMKTYIQKFDSTTNEYINENKHSVFSLMNSEELLSYDLYTQIKVSNNISTLRENNKTRQVTQGIIFDSDFFLLPATDELRKEHIQKQEERNAKKNKKIKIKEMNEIILHNIPYKSENKIIELKIKKCINELIIKNICFNKIAFNKTKNNYFSNIKVILRQRIKDISAKNNYRQFYSFVEIEKNTEDLFYVKDYYTDYKMPQHLPIHDTTDKYNSKQPSSDLFFIFDDKYILVINEDHTITILGREINLNNSDLNPLSISKQMCIKKETHNIKENNLTKKAANNDNLFFPFNVLNYNSLLESKLKTNKKDIFKNKKSCVFIEKDKEGAVFFTQLSDNSMNTSMDQTTLLSKIKIYQIDPLSFSDIEDEDIKNKIIAFYLSFMTFDFLNINSASKTTLLEKMVNLVLHN